MMETNTADPKTSYIDSPDNIKTRTLMAMVCS